MENERKKKFQDYLANKFDFDGATLTEALKKTFEIGLPQSQWL